MPHRFQRRALAYLFAVGFVLAGVGVFASQLAGRPAEEWIKTLDGETRIKDLRIEEVVAAMKLQPGQTVADIGAGTGLFSIPVAKAAGARGRVYAVEVDAGFFPSINKRAADNGVANVQTVLGVFTDPKLPATNIDLAFFHDVLHHIEDRAGYLKTLARYMAPNGRIFVVDFEGGKGPHLKQKELQVSREDLAGWMKAAGFVQIADTQMFADKYVLTFGRASAAR